MGIKMTGTVRGREGGYKVMLVQPDSGIFHSAERGRERNIQRVAGVRERERENLCVRRRKTYRERR